MASYRNQNGQPYSQNHPSQAQPNQYGTQPAYADHSLRRRPSFDNGDDTQYFDPEQNQSRMGEYQSYGGANNLGSQHGSARTPQTSLPYRTPSQNAPLTGYQHQQQPAPNYTGYNPAQFSQAQPQYVQPQSPGYGQYQSYPTPTSPHSTSGYQPYVPAAYQETNVQRQPSLYSSQHYQQPPQNVYATTQALPPPPRPSDYNYIQQPNSYGAYQHETQYQQTYSSQQPVPLRQAPYSPPAPLPPLHDARSTSQPYSHAPSYTHHDSYQSQNSQPSYHGHPSPSTYQGLDRRESSSASRLSYQSAQYSSSPQPPAEQIPDSQASPRRTDTLSRHPQARPLPGPPSESESDSDHFGARNGGQQQTQGDLGYEDLMKEVDAAINQGQPGTQPSTQGSQDARSALFAAGSPKPHVTPDEVPTHINGSIATSGDHHINYGAFSDDSDAEAAAGLAALQAAEEQDAAEEARRRSGSASLFNTHTSQRQSYAQPSPNQDMGSDSDYANVDMGFIGGGYEANLHYGDQTQSNYAAAAAAMPSGQYSDSLNPRMNSVRSSGVSSEGRESQTSGYESIPTFDAIHPFPPFRTDVARVDTGGTGGLTEPSPHPRRMSFEDGDETNLLDQDYGRVSGSVSPSRDSLQDMFYHPGLSPQRPLPPPPSHSDPGRLPHLIPAGSYAINNRYSQHDQNTRPYSTTPDNYQQSLQIPPAVPRSTSLSSARSVPRTDQPIRSKTDADRAKLLRAQMAGRPMSVMSDVYEGSVPSSAAPLDLPTIPRKKFNPSKIPGEQYKKCSEPWALSSILSWIKDLAEEEADLREQAISESLVNLFTHKVPTMNTADAETLGERVVREMFNAGALIKEEEWVKFGPGTMTGVLFQLTGTGCYSPRLHLHRTRGRCYSYHCMRTLKKADLSLPMEAMKKIEDWATFYKLKKEDIEGHDSKEIKRQNILHEVVTSEDSYISHLDILRILYRDQLTNSQIIPAAKVAKFVKEVFGQVDQVKKVNEDFLLAQLKYRQNEQGPWIVGFSDIFREWIRRARSVYIEYAANYPRADYLVRREAERNLLFKQFLDQARDDKRSNRLAWDTYMKDPITRLQRYSLLLMTIDKEMIKPSEEKTNLLFAIDEVRAATFECNAKLAENEKKMDLIELGHKIRLRKGMEKEVELNLDHLGREILMRGDLQRAGGKGFQWVDTTAILFDHYFVLAKKVVNRDSTGGPKHEIYDVSKVPIPMDLIVLESTNEDPVVKSSVKGIGAVTTTVTARGSLAADPRLARTTSTASGGPGTLTHTNTSTSIGSGNTGTSGRGIMPTTVLEPNNPKDERIMFPFRIKHLGKTETYTLYAPSATNRQEWCEAIIEAKTRHAASLYAQNAEPFRLRVLADAAFAYDGLSVSARRIVIKGTPLDRAIKEAERSYEGQGRPAPVCRAAVNCATVFNQPYGRLMCAVGTDFGVFISEYQNPRGWTRAITLPKVTQVAVFEEFNLFLLIADKALIAYHLDVVCPPSGSAVPQNDASSRKAPQKLSGSKDVGFFATGKMKDRALVFYKKRDGLNSTFKVLEPVLQKSTATRSRFLPTAARRGQTEFFREYDEFYIPAECYGINLYHSSLAISTARGVEVLTLDKKQPWSVPNLRSDQIDAQAHLSSIASRIKDLRPLGMFRMGEAEFLVAFEECAVYVNKHGDISRGVVMEFVGRAKSACLHGQYLILFDDDFVEIRDAMNGRLKQVIAGKDIKLLDDGGGGSGGANTQAAGGLGGGLNGLGLQGLGAAPRTVKICMQHPDHERSHVLVELLENGEPKD